MRTGRRCEQGGSTNACHGGSCELLRTGVVTATDEVTDVDIHFWVSGAPPVVIDSILLSPAYLKIGVGQLHQARPRYLAPLSSTSLKSIRKCLVRRVRLAPEVHKCCVTLLERITVRCQMGVNESETK